LKKHQLLKGTFPSIFSGQCTVKKKTIQINTNRGNSIITLTNTVLSVYEQVSISLCDKKLCDKYN